MDKVNVGTLAPFASGVRLVIDPHHAEYLQTQFQIIERLWEEINPERDRGHHLVQDHLPDWSLLVVKAFGTSAFPTYIQEPWLLPFDNSNSLIRNLTGTENAIEAGKRIIIWTAANREPALLISGPEWHDRTHYRFGFRRWSEALLEEIEDGWAARIEPFDWMRLALQDLLRSSPNESDAAYRPAMEMFLTVSGKFKDYKQFRSFLEKYEVRTHKPSRNRLMVHAAECLTAVSRFEAQQLGGVSDEIIQDFEKRKASTKAKKHRGK